jgi:glycosyltransferase involved in cell wall biosynthesis
MAERVLHVCESTVGGVGVVIAELARDQAARGQTVAVAAPLGGPFLGDLASDGVRIFGWDARAQPGPWVAREMAALRRIIDEFDPTVVHLHSSKAGLVGRLVLRRRRPTILQPHSWSFWARTGAIQRATLRWERMGARWTDVVLCVSDEERRVGQESGVRTRYRVLPNGADLERFQPGDRAAARAQLGIDADVPLAACVGRLHRQKNQAALLDVWERVRAAAPGARLALVGDGPDRAQLEARAPDGVDFAGSVDDVRPWLVAADVIAQPSRWEGMSLALLEALATARSVVVTDVPGMREVVVDGIGVVVPPDDPDALLEALVERLRDRARADDEGRAGREHVERNHDRRSQLDAVAALYEELLADRRRSSTSSDNSAMSSFDRPRS